MSKDLLNAVDLDVLERLLLEPTAYVELTPAELEDRPVILRRAKPWTRGLERGEIFGGR